MDLREHNLEVLGMTNEQIEAEITVCRERIKEHIKSIGQVFVDMGMAQDPSAVKITIGPELECTQIAGYDAYLKRTAQILGEMDESQKKGKRPTFNINDKKGAYMPEAAHVGKLDAIYEAKAKRLGPHVRRTRVDPEPTFQPNTFSDPTPITNGNGRELMPDMVAASQIEFTAPALTPLGAAEWINKTMDMVVHGAPALGLRRVDFRAVPSQATSPNSIHLNSVIRVNTKNAFSKAEMEDNPDFKGQPSELLLCVGKAHLAYLKHSLFMFARAENDYERFSANVVSGPSFLGVSTRKEHGNYATAMFRGEGRTSERLNSLNPNKPDSGDMRFELRVPGSGAAGHPNKQAYPEQRILPYQMIEAYMHMLLQGALLWKRRALEKKHDLHVPDILESALHPGTLLLHDPQGTPLPDSKAEAVERFVSTPQVQEYWGERIDTMMRISNRIDEINERDTYPMSVQKGAHIGRLLTRKTNDNSEKQRSRADQ